MSKIFPDHTPLTKASAANQCNTVPTLLIVEDNADSVFLIESFFKKDFTILIAENGQEGYETARQQLPDIILSDIMMPMMDGVSLCKALKADSITNHIPVILLTAKSGDNNILIGLNAGADDYIVKPFNQQRLKTKIDNLIRVRQTLKEKYSNERSLEPHNVSLPANETHFSSKLKIALKKNLSNPEYNVSQFCQDTQMSRTQLHRKLKALTGLSATAFIRYQRIKMAAQLLRNPNHSISEICYATGFNDSSYFSKCFKEIHGCSPTTYQQLNQQKNPGSK